jgi:hypothetical protein
VKREASPPRQFSAT